MKIAVVVPTIRENQIAKFLDAWDNQFYEHNVYCYVIEDNEQTEFSLPIPNFHCFHISHESIDGYKNDWIFPRKTDCIRSFGFLRAYNDGADIIITLDDDCIPSDGNEIKRHIYNLQSEKGMIPWHNTIDFKYPRGYPFQTEKRKCVISHGLWDINPDLDAITKLTERQKSLDYKFKNDFVPVNYYYPMCGMNLAFTREILPAMYFLLMGQEYGVDRFGDIWCGIISKKIIDHLNYCVWSGRPNINHQGLSDLFVNLEKEMRGYQVNEYLWKRIDKIKLDGNNVVDCYTEIALNMDLWEEEYFQKLSKAMLIWLGLLK